MIFGNLVLPAVMAKTAGYGFVQDLKSSKTKKPGNLLKRIHSVSQEAFPA
jgi:hypothetical protein